MMWSLGFLVLGIIWVISVYNGIIHAEVKIEEAKSGIDVALSKRYAILTNMQESVKGYMKHEKEVFEQLTKIRSSMTLTELSDLHQQYYSFEQKLMILSENYPELKASALFLDFQNAIVDCEEHLQAARRFYNSNVTLYNEKILMFPGSLVASWMHKERADFFEAEVSEKDKVQVSI